MHCDQRIKDLNHFSLFGPFGEPYVYPAHIYRSMFHLGLFNNGCNSSSKLVYTCHYSAAGGDTPRLATDTITRQG
jgi:hypothetical protein